MKHPQFRFTAEYVITGLDEDDAIERFQELLDEDRADGNGTAIADNWQVEEIKDGEVEKEA